MNTQLVTDSYSMTKSVFALADQLEQRLAQARKQVDKLTPSLLARAFAGQLIPQKPADESEEKLLKRVG
jgi:type I restriction enzyme, S subunit